MIYMKSIFEAIETKKDFLKSLNDIGKKTEKEYFEYFGTSPIAIEMYPTIKRIKEEYNISYKELSDIGRGNLIKRERHSSVNTTLKYYNSLMSKNNNQNEHKEFPDYDYLEFIIYFTDNKDLYDKLKPLKEKAACSWEKFKNLKWEDIYLEKVKLILNQKKCDKNRTKILVLFIL